MYDVELDNSIDKIVNVVREFKNNGVNPKCEDENRIKL